MSQLQPWQATIHSRTRVGGWILIDGRSWSYVWTAENVLGRGNIPINKRCAAVLIEISSDRYLN